jgi:hypothetical protein
MLRATLEWELGVLVRAPDCGHDVRSAGSEQIVS